MNTIERMDATFERLKWDQDATLSRDLVRLVMRSDDLEIVGTLYQFLCAGRGASRVVPPLGQSELAEFAIRYLGRCLREDPAAVDIIAQRACTRYGAGWEVVRWYVKLFKILQPDDEALASVRAMLAGLYRFGDANLRATLTGVTLSHLFASSAIRRTFAHWENDPLLREAYLAARPRRSVQSGLRVKRSVQPLTKKSSTAIRT